MADVITVTPPAIKVQVRLPRLYGLRLRLLGWLMIAAGWVSGGLMTIDVEEDGNFKPDPRQPTSPDTPPPPKKGD